MRCFIPVVEIKHCNVMIDWQNVIDHPIKRDFRRYDNIHKITTG